MLRSAIMNADGAPPVRTFRRASLAPWLAGFGLLCGCHTASQAPIQEPEPGLAVATVEPPPGVFRPVATGDLDAIRERGRMLYEMRRTLIMAVEQGAQAVGMPPDDVILPLVEIDPGHRSAAVTFVRWEPKQIKEAGMVAAIDGLRWLRVSLLLHPDRLLDNELLVGQLEAGGDEFRKTEAIIMVATELRAKTPRVAYDMFAVPEMIATDNRGGPRTIVTRVYALASMGSGPDYEFAVAPSRRKDPAMLIETTTIHEADTLTREPALLSLSHPAPATVARALERGPEAPPLVVRTQGVTWEIAARDGRIARGAGSEGNY